MEPVTSFTTLEPHYANSSMTRLPQDKWVPNIRNSKLDKTLINAYADKLKAKWSKSGIKFKQIGIVGSNKSKSISKKRNF